MFSDSALYSDQSNPSTFSDIDHLWSDFLAPIKLAYHSNYYSDNIISNENLC